MLNSRHPMFLWWGPELIQFYNDSYTPSFGIGKHPAAMGQRGEECWPEIWPIIYPQISDVMERGVASWNVDQLVPIFRNGQLEDVYWTYGYSPVFDEQGAIAGTLVICQETTHAVVARSEARQSREQAETTRDRLLNTFENSPSFMCMLSGPQHVFTMVNPLYQRLVGTGRKLVDRPLAEALPEVAEQGFVEILDSVYQSGEVFRGRETLIRLARRDDEGLEDAYVTFVYQPRRNTQGAIDGIDVFGFEVTEQVRARMAAQRAAEHSRALIEAIPQQVWTSDTVGHFDFVSPSMVAYSGVTAAQLISTGWRPHVHPDDRALALSRWSDSLANGSDYEVDFRLRRADGEYRWHLGRAVPLRDADGNISQWFGTNTDVHEHRQAREELSRRAEFEQHLLGIVSHDLRNPLNVILMAATTVGNSDSLEPAVAKNVLRIQSATQRAVRMIRDLLDFTQSRLGGGIRIEPRTINIHELARDVVEEMRISRPERELILRQGGDGDGTWDPDRINQALVNLLSNAIHYGHPAQPVIVRTMSDDDSVLIEVSNSGEPISAELLPTLFKPMQRGPTRGHSSARSVGLGLYIVSEIAKQHKGSVDVRSNSEGTTFSVRLPRCTTQT
ncbi:MAG TPA: PAS domain-containing protein [Polyangiales bacterium]